MISSPCLHFFGLYRMNTRQFLIVFLLLLLISCVNASKRMLDKGQMQRHCFHTLGYRTQGVLCSPLYAIVEH
nr:MAP3K epsilon protein kinase 1-like isoform X3 [Ipomoea batatas]